MAGSPLIGLLCLATRLAALWGRVTAFLKKLLIGSAEGKFLPTVTARNLHISGHRTPCVGLYSPNHIFFARILFEFQKAGQNEAVQGPIGLAAGHGIVLFAKQERRTGRATADRLKDENCASQVTPQGDKFILPRGFPCDLLPRRHSKAAYHRILRGGRTAHPAFPNPAENIRANPQRGQKL